MNEDKILPIKGKSIYIYSPDRVRGLYIIYPQVLEVNFSLFYVLGKNVVLLLVLKPFTQY